ncbi:MAG: nucleotide exchange factor GrpE [Nitrospinota bacterium]
MNEGRTNEGREIPVTRQESDDEAVSTEPSGEEAARPEPGGEDTSAQEAKSPENLQREFDALQDQHLRLRAEFDNFRKRTAREHRQIRERASEQVIKDLLPVIDGLERARDTIPAEDENGTAVKEGIELVLKSLRDILGRHGLEEIQALSQPFDPNLHEAVMVVETEDHPDDTVIEEIQKGYSLGDRVIRPSRVVVAKPVSKEEE